MAPLCLMWCLWRERDALHFEDVETLVIELRKLMLNTLHLWIAAHHSLIVSIADFLNLCSLPIGGSLCILPVYLDCAPLHFI